MNEALKKHAKVLGYLIGSGLCSVALIQLAELPMEYRLILAGAINYLAYAIQLELSNEGIVRNEEKK